MFEPAGQGFLQLEELGLAFVLSSIVGLEREIRQKAAGLRTYTLVGVAAALFTLISKYGFNDILRPQAIVLDPSRIAAQGVSGIGFIGGGVIFMRRDVVRGLTTAASVWMTAALGMACGAGLLVLALATTVAHLIIMFAYPRLVRLLPKEARITNDIEISYDDGRGVLRVILAVVTEARFRIQHVRVPTVEGRKHLDERSIDKPAEDWRPARHTVAVQMQVSSKRPISQLIARVAAVDGVREVGLVEEERDLD